MVYYYYYRNTSINLFLWAYKWQMYFNVDKCSVSHIEHNIHANKACLIIKSYHQLFKCDLYIIITNTSSGKDKQRKAEKQPLEYLDSLAFFHVQKQKNDPTTVQIPCQSTSTIQLPSPGVRVTVEESLIRDLGRVIGWCDLCGMKLNASKKKTMIVSRSRTIHPK